MESTNSYKNCCIEIIAMSISTFKDLFSETLTRIQKYMVLFTELYMYVQ